MTAMTMQRVATTAKLNHVRGNADIYADGLCKTDSMEEVYKNSKLFLYDLYSYKSMEACFHHCFQSELTTDHFSLIILTLFCANVSLYHADININLQL